MKAFLQSIPDTFNSHTVIIILPTEEENMARKKFPTPFPAVVLVPYEPKT